MKKQQSTEWQEKVVAVTLVLWVASVVAVAVIKAVQTL